jgi:transcription elongation factor GreA
MSKTYKLSQTKYDQLREELTWLKTTRVDEIAQLVKEARSFGDLSENSEYDEAKNEQAIIEARISKLEFQLTNVKIVDQDNLDTDTVSVGCKVEILDVDFEETMQYRIISSVESSQSDDTITEESPMGEALLGHRVGDEVEVKAPSGSFKVKILSIGR